MIVQMTGVIGQPKRGTSQLVSFIIPIMFEGNFNGELSFDVATTNKKIGKAFGKPETWESIIQGLKNKNITIVIE